ncbi:tail completion protein gp17 [Paenibacillus azoreducens]|uniref:tail completion protein gp17 n=1 Tax=Paenibacillus azoreducens TaxID=116718 RepID=UPI0039F50198
MMIDLKPKITQALRTNAALISLLGKDKDGRVKVYPEVAPDITGPYITFFELTNFDNKYMEDEAVSSEIHFQVDVWTPGNTSPIASAVNQTMEALGFIRSGSVDQYEKETRTYHKVLRYKTKIRGVD